jgi:hypothetical protein
MFDKNHIFKFKVNWRKNNMTKKEERFKVLEKEGSQLKDSGMIQIIVDTQTGVHYLWIKSGYAGGLTPLLDAEGKPVIEK